MRNRAQRNLNIRASQRRTNPSGSEAGGNVCAHANRNHGANTNAEAPASRDRQACPNPSPYADTCGDGCCANGGVDTGAHAYIGHANVDSYAYGHDHPVSQGYAQTGPRANAGTCGDGRRANGGVDTSTHVYADHSNIDSCAYGYDHADSQGYAQTGPRANPDQCSNGGALPGAHIR